MLHNTKSCIFYQGRLNKIKLKTGYPFMTDRWSPHLPWDTSKNNMQSSVEVTSQYVICFQMPQPCVGCGIGIPVIPEWRVFVHSFSQWFHYGVRQGKSDTKPLEEYGRTLQVIYTNSLNKDARELSRLTILACNTICVFFNTKTMLGPCWFHLQVCRLQILVTKRPASCERWNI